ncbi:conjugal transfer protein, partial [Gordonia sihwensis]|uniref:conjugal transfer protein n=1 Tax=Gordonia sihwensis TaxID=173559 RepID=UPI0005F068A5
PPAAAAPTVTPPAPAPAPAAVDDLPPEPGFDEVLADPDELVDDTVEDSAAGEYLYLPTDDDYTVDKKGRRHFHYWAPEGGGHVAVDVDHNIFTDETGDFIYVNGKGVATHTGQSKALFGKLKNLIKSGGETTEPLSDVLPPLFDENGAPVEHFAVPPIGKPIGVVTEKTKGSRRMVFAASGAAVVMVFGVLIGTWWGRGAVPAQGVISADEASTYRLSQLPVEAMSAFGIQYLQTCLTHGDRNQMKARAALLAQMSTGGASPGCGWTEGGEQQAPLSVAFTGRLQPIPGVFDNGAGAFLDFSVATRAGQFGTYTVPIWVKSASTSNNMSVIGDIGYIPGFQTSVPENYDPLTKTDSALAADLQTNLVEPFLTAWAASSRTQIDLAVTSDATPNAKRGLRGTVKNPDIQSTTAYSPKATSDGQPGNYSDGDTATLVVTVTWTVPASVADLPDSKQTVGYRISVVKSGGKWSVSDIGGGAVTSRATASNNNADSGGQEPGIAGITPGATGGPVDDSSQTTTPSVENQLAPSTSVQP